MVDAELDDAAMVGGQLGEPRGGQSRTVRVAVVLLEVATHPVAGGVFLTLVGHRYVLLGDEGLPRHGAGAENAEGWAAARRSPQRGCGAGVISLTSMSSRVSHS